MPFLDMELLPIYPGLPGHSVGHDWSDTQPGIPTPTVQTTCLPFDVFTSHAIFLQTQSKGVEHYRVCTMPPCDRVCHHEHDQEMSRLKFGSLMDKVMHFILCR
jgi:hypothetical protein